MGRLTVADVVCERWWTVVCGGRWLVDGGGWLVDGWWMVVDGGGWWW